MVVNLSRSRMYALPALAGIVMLTACGGDSGSISSGGIDDPGNNAGGIDGADGSQDDRDELGTIEDVSVGESDSGEGDASNQSDSGSPAGRVGLIVSSTQRCAAISEPLQVVVNRQQTESETPAADGELPNISALVRFDQGFGTSLNLVSRTDASANFELDRQDIVSLTVTLDDGSENNGTVTAFLAGYERENPESFIMRKAVSGGCLYAFKSQDYCVAGLTRSAELAFSRNGLSMSASSCELDNPNGMPVFEITAQ